MVPRTLRAPAEDGGLLAEPPLGEASARLGANRGRLGAWDHDFQGRRAGRLRAMARPQVLAAARDHLDRFGLGDFDAGDPDGPLVLTGHQPELFHPGVWVKNFAAAGLAQAHRGAALNLIVDDDVPKAAWVRVPVSDGAGLRTELVAFDARVGEVPYEDWSVADEATFASFPDRARAALGGLVADPVLDAFWPKAQAAAGRTDRVGLRFAAARRGVEAEWGVRNAEVPLSSVCGTEAFLWFACHLLAQGPRFRAVHNAALRRYRATYGIRSRHHPVPALGCDGEWCEAPFWAWRDAAPRRRPLLVRQRAEAMDLRISGEAEPLMELPLTPDREACCAVDRLRELPALGVRLRTRALTTTLFSRLLLGDLFLHGIGGAKYDELGDEVIRDFFEIDPPSYLTLTMTLRLGLSSDPSAPDAYRRAGRARRDLEFNPDRHLPDPMPPEAEALVAAKRAAVAGPVATRRDRVARFREIRRINEALAPFVAPALARWEVEHDRLAHLLRLNAVALSREYAFVLHSASRLREAFARLDLPQGGGVL